VESGVSSNSLGIYFETGKADLKLDSEATLNEIARVLHASPAMRIFVVGHTDMVGDAAMNMTLSGARRGGCGPDPVWQTG
jgi:OmpA-OmpF porin, OOP family